MRWLKSVAAMVCILAFTAWALAGLPELSERFWNQEAGRQSEREGNSISLTQSNLVDHFTKLDLGIPLQRVEWSGELLVVDFQMTSLSQREQLYNDLYQLSAFSFSHTSNVNRLLIKVYAFVDGENQLLISLDAGREQWQSHLHMEDWLNHVLTYRG